MWLAIIAGPFMYHVCVRTCVLRKSQPSSALCNLRGARVHKHRISLLHLYWRSAHTTPTRPSVSGIYFALKSNQQWRHSEQRQRQQTHRDWKKLKKKSNKNAMASLRRGVINERAKNIRIHIRVHCSLPAFRFRSRCRDYFTTFYYFVCVFLCCISKIPSFLAELWIYLSSLVRPPPPPTMMMMMMMMWLCRDRDSSLRIFIFTK